MYRVIKLLPPVLRWGCSRRWRVAWGDGWTPAFIMWRQMRAISWGGLYSEAPRAPVSMLRKVCQVSRISLVSLISLRPGFLLSRPMALAMRRPVFLSGDWVSSFCPGDPRTLMSSSWVARLSVEV